MNADGTGQRLLTDHPADDEYPTWSSDGAYVAFQSSRYGGPTIWLMRPDGSDASLLVAEQPVGYPMFAPVPVE
jgi:Tol biopolymer transport system component